MNTKPIVLEKISARERLLAAAQELFYEEGINTVGIDRVIERAGVAKASLYNAFGSKDELIRAYLTARHEARVSRMTARLAKHDSPRDKILSVFDDMRENAANAGYRGCAFVRANAELRSEDSVKSVCDVSREWLRSLLGQLTAATGARDPASLTRQLVLLYDGAAVSSQMDGNTGAAQSAREAAISLMDAHGAT
ncbi:MAG: TetR/AcrR family transcriptional regulator [Pseudomonadota bacterium]